MTPLHKQIKKAVVATGGTKGDMRGDTGVGAM